MTTDDLEPGWPAEPTSRPAGRHLPALERETGHRLRGLQGRVITDIGEAIVSGRYRPGALLPRESELIEEYSASRSSMREALKVLAGKGLVEMRQKVGTRVRQRELWNVFDADVLAWHHSQRIGQEILRELIELRQVIEPAAAKFAAYRATMADLNRIERAHAMMAVSVQDIDRYPDADVEFHMAVFAAAHNSLLSRFGHIVADFLRLSFKIQQRALNEKDNRIEDDVRGHRGVYEAIKRGDGAMAAEAMLTLIMNGKESLARSMALDAAPQRHSQKTQTGDSLPNEK